MMPKLARGHRHNTTGIGTEEPRPHHRHHYGLGEQPKHKPPKAVAQKRVEYQARMRIPARINRQLLTMG